MHTAYHAPLELHFEDLFKHFPHYRHPLFDTDKRWRRVTHILTEEYEKIKKYLLLLQKILNFLKK